MTDLKQVYAVVREGITKSTTDQLRAIANSDINNKRGTSLVSNFFGISSDQVTQVRQFTINNAKAELKKRGAAK